MVLLATKVEFLVYEILLSKGKPYKNNREILAMINLIAAYQGITLTLESSVTQPYQAIPQDKEPFHIEGMQTAYIIRTWRDPNLFYTVSVTGGTLYMKENDLRDMRFLRIVASNGATMINEKETTMNGKRGESHARGRICLVGSLPVRWHAYNNPTESTSNNVLFFLCPKLKS
ncbi:unnamed protein product [Lactuca saligna]|uniref:Uncharacterized protein n=1 Tax=Lactuca saligna TaxID=75948 RepID=A0AA35Y7W4_LACSI|nr:unnamed protein product [Lactuca saligna]